MDKKIIVLTLYGTGETIDDLTVTLFDKENYYRDDSIQDYCTNINELELKDNKWIYAFAAKENEKIKIENPLKCDFDIISTLDDKIIQTVIREAGNHELQKALKTAKKETFKAILRNMSKRAAKTLIEGMEYMGPIRLLDVKEAQRKIGSIVRRYKQTTNQIFNLDDFI
jgi:hypothetical protein